MKTNHTYLFLGVKKDCNCNSDCHCFDNLSSKETELEFHMAVFAFVNTYLEVFETKQILRTSSFIFVFT